MEFASAPNFLQSNHVFGDELNPAYMDLPLLLESLPNYPNEFDMCTTTNLFDSLESPYFSDGYSSSHTDNSYFPPTPPSFPYNFDSTPQTRLKNTPSLFEDRAVALSSNEHEDALQPTGGESPIPHTSSPPRPKTADSKVKQNCTPGKRTPHNQVEKKYREALNSEIEKLRLVIPGSIEHLRQSKAMVLATATNYIRALILEREQLALENEFLRSVVKNV